MTTRRSFITGLVSFVAAPAIVRVDSLMRLPPPRKLVITPEQIIDLLMKRVNPPLIGLPHLTWRMFNDAAGGELRYVEVDPWIGAESLTP